MFIKVSWEADFDDLLMHLKSKYGKSLLTLDGIGDQLDMKTFHDDFFASSAPVADVSVDANANVQGRTVLSYRFEMAKPFSRMQSYYLLWAKLRDIYGLEYANFIIEAQVSGTIYINDFSIIELPYCYNYSTYDIALLGLVGISDRLNVVKPKSFDTFIAQIEQFSVYAANSTLGATGFADLLIVASIFVDRIMKTGKDHHIMIANPQQYVQERLIRLIYTLNWGYRSNQSVFSNVSVYDKYFLKQMAHEYMIDGETPSIETIQLVQNLFLDAMNQELERSPLTFPVTTACFSKVSQEDHDKGEFLDREVGDIRDLDFAKEIAEKNLKFGFINLYHGDTSTLSSCCRLRSDKKSKYFNTFGAGSTKIGSAGVVTMNFARLAMQARDVANEDGEGDKYTALEKFLKSLQDVYHMTSSVNNAKRCILKEHIANGHMPLNTHGYVNIDTQYSTAGVNALYEALHIMGFDILTDEGEAACVKILRKLNKWADEDAERYGAPHNIEQVPAENSAIKLAMKDKALGLDCGVDFYSNQFVPLICKTDMLNRLRLQGKFDKHLSGGAIAHINVAERLVEPNDLVELMRFAAKSGVVYWAVNYLLKVCEDKHVWVGKEEVCPKCGKPVAKEITRVVGFFTDVSAWHKVRREQDRPNRQFYDEKQMKLEGK